jgi:protein-disulfide isomerase
MKQLRPTVNGADHNYGNQTAPLELVEYGDYECPYCSLAYPIIKDIQQQVGVDLNFVFRNFPLSKIHPHAFSAAVATEAAGLQDKFWEMHDIIFENQKALSTEDLFHYAGVIGLNQDRFEKDIQQKALYEKVENDFDSGIRSGVNRTPTFFINEEKFDGDWSSGELLQYLKNQLIRKPISRMKPSGSHITNHNNS